jgi:hypothetical protein
MTKENVELPLCSRVVMKIPDAPRIQTAQNASNQRMDGEVAVRHRVQQRAFVHAYFNVAKRGNCCIVKLGQ